MTTTKEWIEILRDSVTSHPEIPAYTKSYILVVLDKIETSMIVSPKESLEITNAYMRGVCPKCEKNGNAFEFRIMTHTLSLYPYLCPECYDSLPRKVKDE